MGAMVHRRITDKGQALLLKVAAGTTLHFTKFEIGSGSVSGADAIPPMTGLVAKVADMPISSVKRADGATVQVSGAFSGAATASDFYFREIGLYAQDPNDGEILFAYGNAGADADLIPGSPSESMAERLVSMNISVGAGAVVTTQVLSGVYALAADVDEYVTNLTARINGIAGEMEGTGSIAVSAWTNNQTILHFAQTELCQLRAQSIVDIIPNGTNAQNSAWFEAGIAWVSQSFASGTLTVTLKAWGNAPTAPLPYFYRIKA
jgi:hypothetical protein